MSRTVTVDLRGLRCPVTTMRLKKALKAAIKGDTFRISADDAESRTDFPALFSKMGLDYAALEEYEGYVVFVATRRVD